MIVPIVNRLLVSILVLVFLVVMCYEEIRAAEKEAITDTPMSMQITPTPNPQAEWVIAGDSEGNDWDTYLTGGHILGIAADNDIIWAASQGGLLRWERETGRVTQYLAPAFPLPSNYLGQVLLYEDKLYISGYSGIAIFDQQDQWQTYSNQEIGLEESFFMPIAIVKGQLWAAGRQKISRLLPSGRWETLKIKGFTFNHILKIVSDSDELYVVIALGPEREDERQVLRFVENSWEIVEDSKLAHFSTPDGSLWSKREGGLKKSEDSGRTWQTVIETRRHIQPRASDKQGRVYATIDDTVLVIEDEQVTSTYQFTSYGPELNYINILKFDQQNRLWVATDGRGMSMFDGQKWFNWQPENSNIRDDAIRGLAVGELFVYAGTHGSAASGGVNIFDLQTQQWTNFWPEESELSGGEVAGIAVDKQGRAFFPTAAGILDIYDDGQWQHIPIPNVSSFDPPLYSMREGAFDQEGTYWVGIDGPGLLKYDGTNWWSYHIQGSVQAFAFDQDNRLWVGSSRGLTVRDEASNWSFYTSSQLGLDDDWIRDIAIDAKGQVWGVTHNYLLLFNGRESKVFLPQMVGAISWGRALTFDSQNQLWVATNSGVVKFKNEPDTPAFSRVVPEPEWVQPDSKLSHQFRTSEQILTSIYSAIMGFCVLLLLVGGAGVYLWFKR